MFLFLFKFPEMAENPGASFGLKERCKHRGIKPILHVRRIRRQAEKAD